MTSALRNELLCRLESLETLKDVCATLERLSPDPKNLPRLLEELRSAAMEGRTSSWEIRVALRALAEVIQPRTYLEVGTRRGWSLVQVLAGAPRTQCLCFDRWVEGYAGADNPGPTFVMAEIRRALLSSHDHEVEFVGGDSHTTLPRYFRTNPTQLFDLVTVDGDHSALGAWWDLTDLMPRVAPGGALVFDDIVDHEIPAAQPGFLSRFRRRPRLPEGIRTLHQVWDAVKDRYRDFDYIENLAAVVPVGIALRRREGTP